MLSNWRAGLPAEVFLAGSGIAALGAIASVNYWALQNSADLALVRSNMRAVSAALETYYADNGSVPLSAPQGYGIEDPMTRWPVLKLLTTPVAYAQVPDLEDPFEKEFSVWGNNAKAVVAANPSPIFSPEDYKGALYYRAWNSTGMADFSFFGPPSGPGLWYTLQSAGPDGTLALVSGVVQNDRTADSTINLLYDPTNGAGSFGSLFHMSPREPQPSQGFAAGIGLFRALEAADVEPPAPEDWRAY